MTELAGLLTHPNNGGIVIAESKERKAAIQVSNKVMLLTSQCCSRRCSGKKITPKIAEVSA